MHAHAVTALAILCVNCTNKQTRAHCISHSLVQVLEAPHPVRDGVDRRARQGATLLLPGDILHTSVTRGVTYRVYTEVL